MGPRTACFHCTFQIRGDRRSSEAEFFRPLFVRYMNDRGLPLPTSNVWLHEKCRRQIRNAVEKLSPEASESSPDLPEEYENGIDGAEEILHRNDDNMIAHENTSPKAQDVPNLQEEPVCERGCYVQTVRIAESRSHAENIVSCGNSQLTSTSASTQSPQFSDQFPVNGIGANVIDCGKSQLTSSTASTEVNVWSETSAENSRLERSRIQRTAMYCQQQHENQFQLGSENEISLSHSGTRSYEMLENVEAQYSDPREKLRPRPKLRPSPKKSGKIFKVRIPNILTVGISEGRCCFCRKKKIRFGQSRIPASAKKDIWNTHRIWIPSDNRCCPSHIHGGVFKSEEKTFLVSSARLGAKLTPSEIGTFIHKLQDGKTRSPINLDKHALKDFDFELLFGVTKNDFYEILSTIMPHMRNSSNRSPANALAMILMKLRLGISQRLIGYHFNMSQRMVSKTIWRTAELLEKYFVPQNLGYERFTREEFLQQHDSDFVRKLYQIKDGCLVLFLDCTYLYVEKSSNHSLQKKTFCLHKLRNLVKPMTVVSATGHTLETHGLYFSDSNHNDASILEDMFEKNTGFAKFVKPGDTFIVDRGFTKVREYLIQKGYEVKMPRLLQGTGRVQFTTDEANESRLVTFSRWVVEASHGRVKQLNKFFENTIPAHYFNTNCAEKLQRLWRISTAIVNRFRPPIFHDAPKHTVYLEEIESRFSTRNQLKEKIKTNKWDKKRTCWKKISGRKMTTFPEVTEEELDKLTLGTYQLKNAQAYVDEHLRISSEFDVYLHAKEPGLMRIKLKGRYRGAVLHDVYLEYGTVHGGKIQQYYCTCKSGARTLGCCSHVACVVWFLGFKRHQTPDYHPKTFGTGILEITRLRQKAEGYPDSEPDEEQSTSKIMRKKPAKKRTQLAKRPPPPG